MSLLTGIVHRQATVLKFDAEHFDVKLWNMSIRLLHTQHARDSTLNSTPRIAKSITSTNKTPLFVQSQRLLHSTLKVSFKPCTCISQKCLARAGASNFFKSCTCIVQSCLARTGESTFSSRMITRKNWQCACVYPKVLLCLQTARGGESDVATSDLHTRCTMILPRVTVLDVSNLCGSWQWRDRMY